MASSVAGGPVEAVVRCRCGKARAIACLGCAQPLCVEHVPDQGWRWLLLEGVPGPPGEAQGPQATLQEWAHSSGYWSAPGAVCHTCRLGQAEALVSAAGAYAAAPGDLDALLVAYRAGYLVGVGERPREEHWPVSATAAWFASRARAAGLAPEPAREQVLLPGPRRWRRRGGVVLVEALGSRWSFTECAATSHLDGPAQGARLRRGWRVRLRQRAGVEQTTPPEQARRCEPGWGSREFGVLAGGQVYGRCGSPVLFARAAAQRIAAAT